VDTVASAVEWAEGNARLLGGARAVVVNTVRALHTATRAMHATSLPEGSQC